MEVKEMHDTKNLNKLSAHANAVTWFEIPVNNMKRAKEFYETILNIQLVDTGGERQGEEMVLFPKLPDVPMGRTNMVSGSLIKSDRLHPSGDGIMIYLNANPSIDKAIARIEKAGGQIFLPKTKNPAGWVCIFKDSEGNKIGIYSGEE